MTAADTYLWMEKWEDFQSLQTKRGKPWTPPWVKTYTSLLHNDDYRNLSGHRRSILHGLWLEFASSRCRLRLDTSSLTQRLGVRVTTADLESLNHAGFLTFCSGTVLEHKRATFWNGSNLEESRQELEEEQKKALAVDVGPNGTQPIDEQHTTFTSEEEQEQAKRATELAAAVTRSLHDIPF